MKKLCTVLFALVLISGISICACAADNSDDAYEAYGLCVVSKAMEYDPDFNINKTVDAKTYADIMNFWFGAKNDAANNPTNADAVCDLSAYAPDAKKSEYTITHFKDFGFIKKEHRAGYKIMCNAGFLNYDDEFLKPNHPLTYHSFFDMLINFEDEAVVRNGFDVSTGVITDSYSEAKSIILRQSTEKKNIEYKFSRMHSFYVYSEGKVIPYSYNVKRGQTAKIYSHEGDIVYISIADTETEFEKNYDITKLRIYLSDPYGNQIIFVNTSSGDYPAYGHDSTLMAFCGKNKITTDDINNYYIDKDCYVIVDKATNQLKYINIIG